MIFLNFIIFIYTLRHVAKKLLFYFKNFAKFFCQLSTSQELVQTVFCLFRFFLFSVFKMYFFSSIDQLCIIYISAGNHRQRKISQPLSVGLYFFSMHFSIACLLTLISHLSVKLLDIELHISLLVVRICQWRFVSAARRFWITFLWCGFLSQSVIRFCLGPCISASLTLQFRR